MCDVKGRPNKLKDDDVQRLRALGESRKKLQNEIKELRQKMSELMAARKRLTCEHLAAQFDVDPRTITRYLERECG